MVKIYCKIENKKIPLVTTGTSPFIGAGQFGFKAYEWRRHFLNNPTAMVEILEASYKAGARGIEAIPAGDILKAAQIMVDSHDDYIVTGSTYPDKDPGIESLIDVGAKLIFVHGMISDNKGKNLVKLLETIESQGAIPGIATHDPIPTIKFVFERSLNVKAFLIPFNARGKFMGSANELEKLVDNTKDYSFVGMKTLAAGTIDPNKAFEYISKHNICSVSIGMVTSEEAKISTEIALKVLSKE
ncbi:MAG: hypothetical protein ACFFAN_09205 [Promethearchaeota archaeon]